jgi:ATPase subunit of ABC transporter with duplicated ATPase domains
MNASTRIAVVGPCKAGKSTLIRGLAHHGYHARQIAQEHSMVPDMWQRLATPDLLIHLHCRFETTRARGLNWLESEYDEELRRLAHARHHADFSIATDGVSPEEVLAAVLNFLIAREDQAGR